MSLLNSIFVNLNQNRKRSESKTAKLILYAALHRLAKSICFFGKTAAFFKDRFSLFLFLLLVPFLSVLVGLFSSGKSLSIIGT